MRGFSRLALVLACLPAFGATALAEEAPTQLASAETVTVTATRNPTSTLEYPGMVDVLGLDEIEAAIPSKISDLVENMPNVQFVGGPRRLGESPNIRGLGGQDVLILVDGVRQSWTSGHDGRFFLDPSLLASVEVVRGPASALYGSGALGGVMAFRTADASDFLAPGKTAGVRASLGYQDVNDEFLRMATAFTHVGNFDFVGSIGQRTSGDIALGSGATLAADDDIVTGFAKAGYSTGDEFSIKLTYQGFNNDAVEPDNGQGIATGGELNKTVTTEQFSGEIEWHPENADFINLHFVPYHLQGSVEEADPASHARALREIKTDGFSVDNRTPFAFGNISGRFTFGGEWYQDEQVGRDTASPGDVRSGVPNGEDDFWGVFAQIEADIAQPLGAPGKLTLIPAIRYDSYSASSTGHPNTEETAVSPKIAATYAPVDWLFVFGNMGKAFRAPGINELYLAGIHFTVPHPILPGVSVANTFIPNPDLKPETSKYWEAGAGLVFDDVLSPGGRLTVKASYWEQNVDDYINLSIFIPPTFYSLGCFTPPTFLVNCNVGTATTVNVDAELQGVELEAIYENERVRFQFGYGATDGNERGSSFDLSSLMPDRFTALATLKIPEVDGAISARGEWAGDFRGHYNPATADPSTDIRDGYTLLDVFATWAPGENVLEGALNGLRVDAGVDNVTDEDYTPYRTGVSAPGRNFKVLTSYTLLW